MSTDEITSSTRLGFIGLGYLGSRIARRLIAAGFPVTVYDRNQAKAAQFSAVGAKVMADLAKLAGHVDVVLSCLRDDAAVEDVFFGTSKVLGAARRITTIIELSTIAPATAKRLHGAGAELGISVLDVAISGSTVAAESATLHCSEAATLKSSKWPNRSFAPSRHSGSIWAHAVPARP